MALFTIESIGLTLLAWLWLWFMIAKPEKWSRFVDRTDAFVRRGHIPSAFEEGMKRFEKGFGMRVFVGIIGIVGTAAVVLGILVWMRDPR